MLIKSAPLGLKGSNRRATQQSERQTKQSNQSQGYKTFSILNLAEHEIFFMLINVKRHFTFISMINTPSERLKAINFFICRYFSFYEQLKIRAQLS